MEVIDPAIAKWFSLENQVRIGLAAAVLMLIGIGIVSYRSINRFIADSRWDRHTYEVLASIHALHADLKDAESDTRGYVITGDGRYLKTVRAAAATTGPKLLALAALTQDNPQQQQRSELLRPLISQRLDRMQDQVRFRQDPRFENVRAALLAIEATSMTDKIDRILGEMEAEESRLLVVRRKDTEAAAHRAIRFIAIGAIFALVVVTVAGWVIRGTIAARTRMEAALRASANLLKEGALQSAIFNSANFSSIATDADGVIQVFNVGAERMLGYTAAEVINKITPADISDPNEMITRANALSIELGTPIAAGFEALVFKASRGIEDIYEVTHIRKDGSRLPAMVSVTALCNAEDAIIGYLLIGTDNTARKRADDALRKSEAQHQTIVESLGEGVVVSDLNGKVLHFNRAALDLHGYASLDECRRNLTEFPDTFELSDMDGRVLPVDQWPLARILRGDKLHDMEVRIRQIHAGWQRVFRYGGTLVQDSGGQALRAVVTISDITERKRAAEEIHQLNAGLEQRVVERTAQLLTANNELEAFSYSVSHDLRAPLRSLDGFSLALLEDCANKLDPEDKDNLQRIRRASQRMGHLIDDLLNLSRLTRVEMSRKIVDLSKIARDVADEFRAAEPERRASFVIAEGLVAQADPQLVRIALTNLFANAWKFSAKRPDARIEFGCAGENGSKEFFVRDNGVGFDMAYAGKLFGAFQRLHAMYDFPGTGIGLVTVQRIIHRHGGRIWAQSAVGAGATFHFTL